MWSNGPELTLGWMAQRALLFSSDPETSRRLAQAFRELEFSVDHCPEIFAAVERITSHRFEVIVADWDDGVEAMFLIKTARELRLNSEAFRIVAAKPEAATAAQNAGAQMVVSKPALPGHTKYALLTSNEFVRRMKTWVPVITPPPSVLVQPAQPKAEVPQPTHEIILPPPRMQPALAMEEDGGTNPRFASPEDPPSLFTSMGDQFQAAQTSIKPRLRLVLWAVLLAGGLSTAYFFATSFKAQASSPSVPSTPRLSTSAGAATAPAPPLRQAASKLTIRVTPRPEPPVAETSVPEPLAAGTEAQAFPPAAQEPLEQVALTPQRSSPSIPASLSVAMDPEIGSKSATSKPSASLMSGVEPVSLAEDLAEKMLLQRVTPDYPMQALQSKLQGAVLLQAWIRKDGTIRDLKVVNGPLVLCRAAYSAVKQWRYKPLQQNGQAVEATTYVTVNFRLP